MHDHFTVADSSLVPKSLEAEVLEHQPGYRGYLRIDRYRLRYRLHAGGWSTPVWREVLERGHAVGVLPYDPVLDRVVLIEQFRIGPYAAGDRGQLVEVVAGIIEPDEAVDDVARRETLEETGLVVQNLTPIAEFYVSPGGASQFNCLFCGHVDAAHAGGIHGLASEHEDIRVLTLPFAEVAPWIEQGHVRDATTLIALQWLLLHRHELRAHWVTSSTIP